MVLLKASNMNMVAELFAKISWQSADFEETIHILVVAIMLCMRLGKRCSFPGFRPPDRRLAGAWGLLGL